MENKSGEVVNESYFARRDVTGLVFLQVVLRNDSYLGVIIDVVVSLDSSI